MLGVVAWTTFLSGSSRMWISVGDKSDLAFYSSLFYEFFFRRSQFAGSSSGWVLTILGGLPLVRRVEVAVGRTAARPHF